MVNWKKFFAEDDISEQNSEDQYKNYEKIKNEKKKSKLEAWFEEDYSKKSFDKIKNKENSEQFEIEYTTHNNEETTENLGDAYYYEEETDTSFVQEKKPSFFSKLLSSKKNNDKLADNNNEYLDEYYDDEDLYDDSEALEDNVEHKKESFFTKIVNLFREPKSAKKENSENIDEIIDDEPEDYKTYFERQKLQNNKNSHENEDITNKEYIEFEEEYDFDEDLFEDQEQTKQQNNSPFSKIKNKFNSIANYGLKEDNDFENEELDLPENEPIKEKSPSKFKEKKEQFLAKMLKTKEEEKLELEFDENHEEIDKINNSFELEMKETLTNSEEKTNEDFEIEEEKSIKDTLNSLGIETTTVKDFDVFQDTREERRQHPTLAAMKVKRRMQDKKIEELGTNIVLEDNKEKFSKDIFSSKQDETNTETKEKLRIPKKSEEREQLNNDFNKITRKNSNNNISSSEDEKEIDNFIKEIKYHEESSKKDIRNYDIEISESDSEKERREKLKFTTVSEVLEGNEDLFEDDIDKTSKFSEDNIDNIDHPQELKQFRNDVFRKKTSADFIENNNSELDNLIIETNIVEKANNEFSPEITKLEENLQLIKKDAIEKNDTPTENTTEISIEKIAKESEIHYPEYDELKQQTDDKTRKNIIDDYSDYNLDYSEIEELTELSKIDSISKNTNIESLTKDLSINNKINNTIDTSLDEQKYTQENYKSQDKEQNIISSKTEDNSEQIGIDYVEKLYIDDTQDYFVDDNSPLVFGEYKTKDYGYRPVSKEKIESNQRKLDAIFEKYSNVKIPKRNTTSYIEQKISSPTTKTVGKYKPSTVYSSIYGSVGIPNKKNEVINENKKKINLNIDYTNKHSNANVKSEKISNSDNKNLFKEIAKQEESVWNIDLGNRVPKKNKKK